MEALKPHVPAKRKRKHSGDINFLRIKDNKTLPRLSTQNIIELRNFFQAYQDVLEQGDSLTRACGGNSSVSVIHGVIDRFFQGHVHLIGFKDGTSLRWQEIVEFAADYPKEFKGDKSKKGFLKFNIKGVMVEISEADYLAICSGIPGQCLAAMHVHEDEERELAVVQSMQQKACRVVDEAQKCEIAAVEQ
jgi:hypothetical protein